MVEFSGTGVQVWAVVGGRGKGQLDPCCALCAATITPKPTTRQDRFHILTQSRTNWCVTLAMPLTSISFGFLMHVYNGNDSSYHRGMLEG